MNFPIYCEDMGYFYKIDSPNECLTVCVMPNHQSIDHSKTDTEVTVHPYDEHVKGELRECSAMGFFKAFTETSNFLIRKSR